MRCSFKHSLVILLLIGMASSIVQNVCEVCTCDNQANVTIVHCDSKNLSTLGDMVFNSTIETLSLVNNSLTLQSENDLGMLNNLTSLKSLFLSGNPLSVIPPLSLPSLIHLQLDNTSLENATFPASYANCTSLQSLVLSNNKLTKLTADDLKTLSSLTNITIDHAQLASIETSALTHLSNHLQSISLQMNSLHSAEFFLTMTNLLAINLDGNRFQQLPVELIAPGPTKHFSFRDNQISIINESSPLFHWANANRSDIEIYLNKNSFDCCQSRWFIHYLHESHNLVRDAANLTCALPTAYSGKRLLDLRVDLMDCSTGPFHPSRIHISKLAVLVCCLISIVIFILVVVVATLYRRNRLHFRRRQEYEQIQGANVLT